MKDIEIRTRWHTYCRKEIRAYLPVQQLELMLAKKSEADKIMDLRGVNCPWSILKAKSQLTIMEPGEVLEVLFTDPLMLKDFPKVLGQKGHQLIQIIDQPEYSRLYVLRGNNEDKDYK